MATILPVANRTVLIGSSEYQSLLDGVRIINLELEKKEDAVFTAKSKIIHGLYFHFILDICSFCVIVNSYFRFRNC